MKIFFQPLLFASSMIFLSNFAFAAGIPLPNNLPLPSAAIPLCLGLGILAMKKALRR